MKVGERKWCEIKEKEEVRVQREMGTLQKGLCVMTRKKGGLNCK